MIQEYEDDYFLEEDKMGMTVSSGSVVIKKDQSNLIGISIGGGAPYCPCLFVVQVFDGTPAASEGTLQSGDELLGVNGNSVKGKTKVAVAKMIQATSSEVTIHYNKLHADPTQGESLDIALKKLKHRLVEGMSSNTADSLGLSRAILCNDSLVKRLSELQGTELLYCGLVDHCKRMLKAHFDVIQCFAQFGRNFAEIKEPQQTASETFRLFSEIHRNMEKDGLKMLKAVKPVLNDLGTYLTKAIPDTKLTIRRYADAKFAYLSYCLKVKELDDEEHTYATLQDPLYRVETGNYEYRLILRCRQEARSKFANLRNDVLEKLELLESKHAQDLQSHLKKLIEGLSEYSENILEHLDGHPNLFPIEVDLKSSAFQYKSSKPAKFEEEEIHRKDTPIEIGEEILLSQENQTKNFKEKMYNYQLSSIDNMSTKSNEILPTSSSSLISGFEEIDLSNSSFTPNLNLTASTLLEELGIAGIDLSLKAELNDSSVNRNNAFKNEMNMNQSLDWLTSMSNQQFLNYSESESSQNKYPSKLDELLDFKFEQNEISNVNNECKAKTPPESTNHASNILN